MPEDEQDRPGILKPAGDAPDDADRDTPAGEREGEDPEQGYGQLAP